ncbi:uncharacterized protein [Temnothorax longispinosus]|uniref:uncharacterized protein n=1 Tax=Temnothorax longispinosus TaxID=300112 RepID=UPI003A9A02CF
MFENANEQEIVNNAERQSFEEKYFEVDARFEELIIERTPETGAAGPNPFDVFRVPGNRDNPPQVNANMKLPRIDLPTFSGSYEDWYPYHDVFHSMIHTNTTLPTVQKMHYLRSSLKDEAADVISSLDIAAENYEKAWAMLKERYDDQRAIMQKHIKAIFGQSVLHKENHAELRHLLDNVLKHLRALKVLKRPIDQWDDLIIHVITTKLPPATNKEWETSLKDSNIPTLKQLTDFLAHRCRTLEAVDRNPQSPTSSNSVGKTNTKKSTVANVATDKSGCVLCKGDHPIFLCGKFLGFSVDKRFQEIKALKLCLNCLKSTDHRAKNCNAGSCKKCSKRHNTLLHMESTPQAKETETKYTDVVASVQSASLTSVNHVTRLSGQHVLLSTAIIHVQDNKGSILPCRAILDAGSQANFVTSELVEKLRLKRHPTSVPISGVGESSTETHNYVNIMVQSRFNGFKVELRCLVLRKIVQDIPNTPMRRLDIRVPPGIKLADPNFMETSKIDILIGAGLFWDLLCVGQIRTTPDQPRWQKTQFGWIAGGEISTRKTQSEATICNLITNEALDNAIAKFWEIEHGARKIKMSAEDRKCVEHFKSTVKRNSTGRFIVKLPIKHKELARLGQSKDIATRQFINLERRLNRNPSLKKDYTEFIHEYEALGHLREVQGQDIETFPHCYLPHHCVIKEESDTTKLRVVFNASCKTTTGVSLNDCLMVGPSLQQDLFSIISRFRTFEFVLVADITKMYRQVLVDESQVSLQRILWRDTPDGPIRVLELLTVTYGTGAAAFLAIKSIRTLAEIEAKNFPIGSKIVLRDFDVDDLITGANTKEAALQVRDETTKLLEKGGFVLRKWASNSPDLLVNLPDSSMMNSTRTLDKEGMCKTLGIQWNPKDDVLLYQIQIKADTNQRVTKRTILSCVAQIFDPLGLLGPVIILAKMLIQRLWTLQLGWDESLPAELHTQWSNYKSQLSQLNDIRISRRAVKVKSSTRIELHGFCDASQNAYGACIYLRTTNQRRVHTTKLLCAKSRVAPLKAVSLPRLELSATQLLAQLTDKVVPILELKIDAVYLWTDSQIVLDWINSSSRRFNTFVANRVGDIQELTSVQSWSHVGTECNPADILSRGATPSVLKDADLWWNGPSWLRDDESSWPKVVRSSVNAEELPEQRKTIVVTSTSHEEFDIIDRFSSYVRLIKTIARCLRFVHNARSKPNDRRFDSISAQELEVSQKLIIRRIQRLIFHMEIEAIENQRPIRRDSRLLALNPFLDHEGLLRVGGRLKNANISYEIKHQLILPARHRLTRLIIEQEHKGLLHAGPQATLAAIRERYWPLSARGIVREVVHKCIICVKARPRISKQIMGDLPATRVTPARPFHNTGVDYCGPIFLREGKRRNARKSKAWIAVFVCFVTKAVHIEVVSDLTTEGFLSALKRFIGRRGRPANIYSDNGTNFVGANRELEELRTLFNREEFRYNITNSLIQSVGEYRRVYY